MSHLLILSLLTWRILCSPSYVLSGTLTELTVSGTNEEIIRDDVTSKCSITTIESLVIKVGITKIGDESFSGASNLKRVILPEFSLTTLCRGCFKDCISLESIEIPSGVETIQSDAFTSCIKLVNISIPSTLSNLISIGEAFKSCGKIENIFISGDNPYFSVSPDNKILVYNKNTAVFCATAFNTIAIPDEIEIILNCFIYSTSTKYKIEFSSNSKLKSIKSGAFTYCYIPILKLPEGLETLENGCFSYAGIETIHIPSTLISMGSFLTPTMKVTVADGCKALWADQNGTLYTGDKTGLRLIPSDVHELYLQPEIASVNSNFIRESRNLTTLEIKGSPNFASYKNAIYDSNFNELKVLAGGVDVLIVHNSCTRFGSDSLTNTYISRIDFQNSKINTFGLNCLSSTNRLTSIDFPSTLSSIDAYSLQFSAISCDVTLSESLTQIKEYSLRFTHISSLNLKACINLRSISEFAFDSINELKSVVLPDGLTSLSASCFSSCANLVSISIPSSITSISNQCFANDPKLVIEFDQQNSDLTIFSERLFYNSGIKSIDVPNNVESIEMECFLGCSELETVSINDASKLRFLRGRVFSGCSKLSSIHFGSMLSELTNQALSEMYGLQEITISESNTVFSSHDGVMYSKNGSVLVVFPGGIEEFLIKDSVHAIGDYAFYKCIKLKKLQFNQDVPLQSIGAFTFLGCEGLNSLEFPSATEELKESCFSGCSNLVTVKFANSSKLSKIASGSFTGCLELETVDFGSNSSLQLIGDSSFSGCVKLRSMVIPGHVKAIGTSSFLNCKGLVKLEFESVSDLEEISTDAFQGCSSLASVHLPSSLKFMRKDCFKECTKLEEVSYCGNFEHDESCFEGCPLVVGLVSLRYPSSTFGGAKAMRIYDGDCQTATIQFTLGTTQESVKIGMLICATVINSDDFE